MARGGKMSIIIPIMNSIYAYDLINLFLPIKSLNPLLLLIQQV